MLFIFLPLRLPCLTRLAELRGVLAHFQLCRFPRVSIVGYMTHKKCLFPLLSYFSLILNDY